MPQYQALYAQNSDLAGWIQIDGTNINYPVMQSKHDPDFYLKHNFEKADSPHGCPYVQANCDLQTPSDNILVYGHNMKDGTMFSDLLQYKRESFWEQHRIIRFDTMTAQAEYTVMAVFRGEAEDLFAYYQCADTETPQEFAAYEFNHYYELQNVSTERYVNILGNHENGTVKNRERVRSSM